MAHHVLMAVIAAISIGSLSISTDAAARAGGGGAGARGGGGGGGHVGFSRGAVQPSVRGGQFRGHVGGRFGPQGNRGPQAGKPGPYHGNNGLLPNQARRDLFYSRRGLLDGKYGRDARDIGLGLPFGGAGYIDGGVPAAAYVGSTVPAAPYVGGAYAPGIGAPAGGGGPVFYRHVCRSDVQVVPSGTRGEAEVTVTRCYVVAD